MGSEFIKGEKMSKPYEPVCMGHFNKIDPMCQKCADFVKRCKEIRLSAPKANEVKT